MSFVHEVECEIGNGITIYYPGDSVSLRSKFNYLWELEGSFRVPRTLKCPESNVLSRDCISVFVVP